MGDFFKPWRRKIGVVTLSMALVATVGWVRSLSRSDVFSIPSAEHQSEILHSGGNFIAWVSYFRDHPSNEPIFPEWNTFPYSEKNKIRNAHETAGINWNWRVLGFGYGTLETKNKTRVTFRIVPYWSVTIPLTLISFWLLLSKSRQSTRRKSTEPYDGPQKLDQEIR